LYSGIAEHPDILQNLATLSIKPGQLSGIDTDTNAKLRETLEGPVGMVREILSRKLTRFGVSFLNSEEKAVVQEMVTDAIQRTDNT